MAASLPAFITTKQVYPLSPFRDKAGQLSSVSQVGSPIEAEDGFILVLQDVQGKITTLSIAIIFPGS